MPKSNVKTRILHRLGAKTDLGAWTPVDFLDVGRRDVVDKVLQRLSLIHIFGTPATNSE